MSRRILVAAVTAGAIAAALVSYVGIHRQHVNAARQLELQILGERPDGRRSRTPIIDTHPLEGLRGSPFPPDNWAK